MLDASGIVMRPTVSATRREVSAPNSTSPPVVTRTMPVGNGGKFTQEARAIYELVLEMQRVRPFTLQ